MEQSPLLFFDPVVIPCELWVAIFSYLSKSNDVLSVMWSCRMWGALVKQNELIETLLKQTLLSGDRFLDSVGMFRPFGNIMVPHVEGHREKLVNTFFRDVLFNLVSKYDAVFAGGSVVRSLLAFSPTSLSRKIYAKNDPYKKCEKGGLGWRLGSAREEESSDDWLEFERYPKAEEDADILTRRKIRREWEGDYDIFVHPERFDAFVVEITEQFKKLFLSIVEEFEDEGERKCVDSWFETRGRYSRETGEYCLIAEPEGHRTAYADFRLVTFEIPIWGRFIYDHGSRITTIDFDIVSTGIEKKKTKGKYPEVPSLDELVATTGISALEYTKHMMDCSFDLDFCQVYFDGAQYHFGPNVVMNDFFQMRGRVNIEAVLRKSVKRLPSLDKKHVTPVKCKWLQRCQKYMNRGFEILNLAEAIEAFLNKFSAELVLRTKPWFSGCGCCFYYVSGGALTVIRRDSYPCINIQRMTNKDTLYYLLIEPEMYHQKVLGLEINNPF